MTLITCRNLSFAYDGRDVLKNVNFHVDSGNYLCIVGENGAGKSTLIKGLLGLKSPSTGNISFESGLKQKEVGYLPQQSAVQKDFPTSVMEVVLSGTLNKSGLWPFYKKADRKRALEIMDTLGIYDLRNSCYRRLSGGQQQRVLLARALCATSKVLLLDEPVTGLDPIMTAEFYKYTDKLNKELGISIIMVTHSVKEALPHGSHVLHLSGEQLFYGTREDYMKSDLGIRFLGGGIDV